MKRLGYGLSPARSSLRLRSQHGHHRRRRHGQHSSGDYSVELNNQNGGLPSPGRNGPLDPAKAALLSQQCAASEATRSGDSICRTGGSDGRLNRFAI